MSSIESLQYDLSRVNAEYNRLLRLLETERHLYEARIEELTDRLDEATATAESASTASCQDQAFRFAADHANLDLDIVAIAAEVEKYNDAATNALQAEVSSLYAHCEDQDAVIEKLLADADIAEQVIQDLNNDLDQTYAVVTQHQEALAANDEAYSRDKRLTLNRLDAERTAHRETLKDLRSVIEERDSHASSQRALEIAIVNRYIVDAADDIYDLQGEA